ncbi:hypothetical protein ACFUOZ_19575 [Paenarthrobacter sp. NPDC057355]|uniref:hypothetical protein n=1 Tax=Paenarthrobacter sp. NPDC057355 TaxID=3346105 RepID=UPI003633E4D4
MSPEEQRSGGHLIRHQLYIETPALVDWLVRCVAPTFAMYAGYPDDADTMGALPQFTAEVLSKRTRPGTIRVFDEFNERIDDLWMETINARVRQGATREETSPSDSFKETLTVKAGNVGRWAARPSNVGWHAYRTLHSCARLMAAADGSSSARLALAVTITDYQALEAANTTAEVLERMAIWRKAIPDDARIRDYTGRGARTLQAN